MSNEGRPSILVVNVHKGASTFIADEFGAAVEFAIPDLTVTRFGSEVLMGTATDEMVLAQTDAMFVRIYPSDLAHIVEDAPTERAFENIKMVLLYRDPRDAAVSMFYSTAFSHSLDVRNPDSLLATRERLQSTPVRDGVQQSAQLPMREFKAILALAESYPEAYVSSYEHLVGDYAGWLQEFCDHVGWSAKEQRKLFKETHGSFEPPTTIDPNNHKRRITPGNWQEVFDDELRAIFDEGCGSEMQACGYTW